MRDFHLPGRSPVLALNGMCATSHPLAAQTAIATMQAGGNALDAAIAAAVLLGLAEPQMTGLGGDCFALVKPAGTAQVHAVNGSGRAPAGLSAADLRAAGHTQMPLHHGAAVTVPGAVDAFCAMSEKWGRLGLDALFAPAIRYAEEGIPVAPRVAFDWHNDAPVLQGAARGHYLIDGQVPQVGQLFCAPGQAEVLRRIARDGRAGFYDGEVAEDMLAALDAAGGNHAAEDLAATAASFGTPITGGYKGVQLVEHPPNGQGVAAILMANILAQFDLAALEPFGPKRAHLELEAAKLAHDARDRVLADADHMTRLAHMTAPETAQALAALISPIAALPVPVAPRTEAIHRDTVYVSVVDRDRMAVSLIYSIFHGFGSGIASERFGILFHNRGAGFNLIEGHPNEAGPGKRPLHTILPAMLRTDGQVSTVFGVMGGGYQPTGHARMLTNWVDYGLGLQEALDAPRVFADGATVQVERGYGPAVAQDLAALGPQVATPVTPLGGAQAIRIDATSGLLEGASDPRKDGCALGY